MKLAYTLLAALLLAPLAALPAADAPKPPAQPNIVFLYSDDMRWDAYGIGQKDRGDQARFPWVQTPNIDRLALEGVRFRESFVVNSLCSPGRACVLTSRYSHLNGIISNHKPFPLDALTVATQLKKAGYTTGYFGKFHMGSQPERPGFDYHASFLAQGDYNNCPLQVNGVATRTTGWVDDVSTGYATRWIQQQSEAKQPFFVFLGFKSPHVPRGGENLPARVRDLYAGQEINPVPNLGHKPPFLDIWSGGGQKKTTASEENSAIIDYLRHISAIDTCVGQVLKTLAATGQLENTIVAFAGDNGYYLGEHNLDNKRSAYDESLRVPFLVRLPGPTAPRGIVCDAMALNIDYAPTFLDYASAPALPEGQGLSLRPAIESAVKGQAPANWRTAFFYEYFKEGKVAMPTVLAVRTATHKLITYPGHPAWTELFDLLADPHEMKNLADDKALHAQLQGEFDSQAKAVQFRMPEGFDPVTGGNAASTQKSVKKKNK